MNTLTGSSSSAFFFHPFASADCPIVKGTATAVSRMMANNLMDSIFPADFSQIFVNNMIASLCDDCEMAMRRHARVISYTISALS
jgi:hypothetical protein